MDIYNPHEECDLYTFYRGMYYANQFKLKKRKSIRFVCEDRRKEGFYYKVGDSSDHLILYPSDSFLPCANLRYPITYGMVIVIVLFGGAFLAMLVLLVVGTFCGRRSESID
jgi:hypothetical protein